MSMTTTGRHRSGLKGLPLVISMARVILEVLVPRKRSFIVSTSKTDTKNNQDTKDLDPQKTIEILRKRLDDSRLDQVEIGRIRATLEAHNVDTSIKEPLSRILGNYFKEMDNTIEHLRTIIDRQQNPVAQPKVTPPDAVMQRMQLVEQTLNDLGYDGPEPPHQRIEKLADEWMFD